MTRYIAAYDTESPVCLAACRKIVEVHRRHGMPATFFITGVTLEADREEYRRLLKDPLFEIASHTWSHGMLLDHPFCGESLPRPAVADEIVRGKVAVERVFDRPCLGLRPGCGFVEGLKGAGEVLELVQQAGFKYLSSLAWGPDYSMPALLRRPFTYKEDGFPALWEFPGHGWQENLLKDHNRWGPRRLVLWPTSIPEAIPARFVRTPQEEFAVHRVFLETAAEEEMPYVSLIWHPWSLHRSDAHMEMLDLVFTHVGELGLQPTTFADLYEHLAGPSSV
jgi:hypothetical protein